MHIIEYKAWQGGRGSKINKKKSVTQFLNGSLIMENKIEYNLFVQKTMELQVLMLYFIRNVQFKCQKISPLLTQQGMKQCSDCCINGTLLSKSYTLYKKNKSDSHGDKVCIVLALQSSHPDMIPHILTPIRISFAHSAGTVNLEVQHTPHKRNDNADTAHHPSQTHLLIN